MADDNRHPADSDPLGRKLGAALSAAGFLPEGIEVGRSNKESELSGGEQQQRAATSLERQKHGLCSMDALELDAARAVAALNQNAATRRTPPLTPPTERQMLYMGELELLAVREIDNELKTRVLDDAAQRRERAREARNYSNPHSAIIREDIDREGSDTRARLDRLGTIAREHDITPEEVLGVLIRMATARTQVHSVVAGTSQTLPVTPEEALGLLVDNTSVSGRSPSSGNVTTNALSKEVSSWIAAGKPDIIPAKPAYNPLSIEKRGAILVTLLNRQINDTNLAVTIHLQRSGRETNRPSPHPPISVQEEAVLIASLRTSETTRRDQAAGIIASSTPGRSSPGRSGQGCPG